MVSSLGLAYEKINLSEHGQDLTRATFLVRYNFSKTYGKDWTASSYAERKTFLTDWHRKLMADEKKTKIANKEEARLAREKQKAQLEQRKKESIRLKALAREEIDEDRNFNQRKRNLDLMVRDQERTLQQLQRKSTSPR